MESKVIGEGREEGLGRNTYSAVVMVRRFIPSTQ